MSRPCPAGLDDATHGVVGEAPVERLDQGGGGEVADPTPRHHGGLAETDEQVALAGARGTHEDDVLGAADTAEGGEVVERGPWHGRLGEREVLEGAGHREARGPPAGGLVRGISRGDLGLHERPQQLVGRPALDLGGREHFGREATDRGEFEALEPGLEIRLQRRLTCRKACPFAFRDERRGSLLDSIPQLSKLSSIGKSSR